MEVGVRRSVSSDDLASLVEVKFRFCPGDCGLVAEVDAIIKETEILVLGVTESEAAMVSGTISATALLASEASRLIDVLMGTSVVISNCETLFAPQCAIEVVVITPLLRSETPPRPRHGGFIIVVHIEQPTVKVLRTKEVELKTYHQLSEHCFTGLYVQG